MASEHDACSSSSVMNPHKIPVFLVNGKPKIWNAKDAVMLREHHRVVGVLVGCLPRHPRQNLHLGLPLQLLPEELTLLLDKGVVRLVKEKTTTSQEYLRRAEVVEEERKASFESQQELFQEERRREMLRNKERILEGQREKRQRLMMTQSQNTPPTPETDPDEEQLHLDRIQFPATAEKHLLVQLFSENPWQQETESAEDDWAFPHTYLEKVRCLVFRDLWEKGHFLTSGQKFGGDFLAYPGDPSRFHSFYIVMCVEQDRQLPALDLVAMGRLGATVRKTVLIASLDSESSVQYTSLQWTWMS
ncbi:tRNA-splicing endonuclease subunit Sen34-like [Babylonia areolata]|uniref:tRNA-splicing endonuclease subunit Sen34-like n=1 Tax=Babylonia areolata TaxID=304850 RepID=UPI003FD1930A